MRHAAILLLLASTMMACAAIIPGCAGLASLPPRHTGDRLLGSLELRFSAPYGPTGGEIEVTITADLRNRTWTGLHNDRKIRYLTYTLEDRQLHLVRQLSLGFQPALPPVAGSSSKFSGWTLRSIDSQRSSIRMSWAAAAGRPS